MAQNFVAQLPIVSRADLVYGNQCGICREDYGTNIAGSDIVTEWAVRLPCGHEFGFDCLSSWLSPNEGQNSCPSCRHELFPTAPDIDDGFAQLHHDDIVDVYFDIAASIHSSLSASAMPTASRIEHRSPGFRDWLLYSQLQAQESSLLPPWRPTSVDEFCPRLNAAHEEALFQELRRRRAFRVLPIPGPVGSLASEREIWNILREQGYYYAPLHAPTASGCFWTRM